MKACRSQEHQRIRHVAACHRRSLRNEIVKARRHPELRDQVHRRKHQEELFVSAELSRIENPHESDRNEECCRQRQDSTAHQ